MSSRKFIRPSERLTALKFSQTLKMATSAHAYVRGSTVQFYEWLEKQKSGSLPEGPAIWICGDCHSGKLAANFLASVVGKAHARQMARDDREKWANELERYRTKQLDAPSWLWSSVVALIGNHETAYLDHCRRYAAAHAA